MGRHAAKVATSVGTLDDASLAALALIAHELNNITVPMEGFAEHALQHIPGYGVVRECVREFQIGLGRIRALASDLESLGQTDLVREVTSLADCIDRVMPGVHDIVAPIEWSCPRDIKVRLDPVHAQRAIASLIRLAVTTDAVQYPGEVTITQKALGEPSCAVCDASLRGAGEWVFLRTSAVRRLNPDVFRDPFRSDTGGRTSRRLALAVLDRCAHRADGHVFLDHPAGFLALALPLAHSEYSEKSV